MSFFEPFVPTYKSAHARPPHSMSAKGALKSALHFDSRASTTGHGPFSSNSSSGRDAAIASGSRLALLPAARIEGCNARGSDPQSGTTSLPSSSRMTHTSSTSSASSSSRSSSPSAASSAHVENDEVPRRRGYHGQPHQVGAVAGRCQKPSRRSSSARRRVSCDTDDDGSSAGDEAPDESQQPTRPRPQLQPRPQHTWQHEEHDQAIQCHQYNPASIEETWQPHSHGESHTRGRYDSWSAVGSEAQQKQRALEWDDSDSDHDVDDSDGENNRHRLESPRRRRPAQPRIRPPRPTLVAARQGSVGSSRSSSASSSPRRSRDGVVYDKVPIRDTPHNPFLGEQGGPIARMFAHRAGGAAADAAGRGEDAAKAYRKGMITYVFRGQRIVYADSPSDLEEDEEDLLQPDGSTRPRYRFQPKLLFPEAHESESRRRTERLRREAYDQARKRAESQQRAFLQSQQQRAQIAAFARSQSVHNINALGRPTASLRKHQPLRRTLTNNSRPPVSVSCGDLASLQAARGQKRVHRHDESSADESFGDETEVGDDAEWSRTQKGDWSDATAQPRPLMPSASSTSSIFKMARRRQGHDGEAHRNRHRLSQMYAEHPRAPRPDEDLHAAAAESRVPNHRLLAQMDRAGWHSDGSEEEEDNPGSGRTMRNSHYDNSLHHGCEYQDVDSEGQERSSDDESPHEWHAEPEQPFRPAPSLTAAAMASATTRRPTLPHRAATALSSSTSFSSSSVSSSASSVATARYGVNKLPAAGAVPAVNRLSTSASWAIGRSLSENPFDLNFLTHSAARKGP
ncbi:unnamed protein product [Parajaminaea phylloscopi]